MRALILGASGGIGAAVAARLRDGGADVTGLSRSGDGLDLTDAETLNDHAARLDGQHFDLIFNATGALMIDGSRPEKSFDAADADAMARQFALNATGVALAIRYFGARGIDQGQPAWRLVRLSRRQGRAEPDHPLRRDRMETPQPAQHLRRTASGHG